MLYMGVRQLNTFLFCCKNQESVSIAHTCTKTLCGHISVTYCKFALFNKLHFTNWILVFVFFTLYFLIQGVSQEWCKACLNTAQASVTSHLNKLVYSLP